MNIVTRGGNDQQTTINQYSCIHEYPLNRPKKYSHSLTKPINNFPKVKLKYPKSIRTANMVATPKKRKSRNRKAPAFSNIPPRRENNQHSYILLYPL
jgi:hypothetical protein